MSYLFLPIVFVPFHCNEFGPIAYFFLILIVWRHLNVSFCPGKQQISDQVSTALEPLILSFWPVQRINKLTILGIKFLWKSHELLLKMQHQNNQIINDGDGGGGEGTLKLLVVSTRICSQLVEKANWNATRFRLYPLNPAFLTLQDQHNRTRLYNTQLLGAH